MPTLEQKWDVERGVVGESADRPYLVTDAADESEARTFAQANVPTTLYGTLTLRRLELVERVGLTQWEFLARYERPTYIWYGSSPPDARFAFDTSGGTQHITQSLATVGKYGPKASEELKGAIGYDGKNVQGVDITVPVYNFTETHFFAEDDIDDAYKIACMELTGKTNAAVFRGFAAGEVLFLGASGTRQGDDESDLWEITYRFAASRKKAGLTVGSITGIAKNGWEYLWVQYADAEDVAQSQVVKTPVAVYVEQVYDSGDFTVLELD